MDTVAKSSTQPKVDKKQLRAQLPCIVRLKEAFDVFGKRDTNVIPADKMVDCLRAWGQNPKESMLKNIKKPGDTVSFEELLYVYHTIAKTAKHSTIDTAEDFINGISEFDVERTGFMAAAKFRHLLTTLGEKLTEAEYAELETSDCVVDGQVNYAKFIRQVMADRVADGPDCSNRYSSSETLKEVEEYLQKLGHELFESSTSLETSDDEGELEHLLEHLQELDTQGNGFVPKPAIRKFFTLIKLKLSDKQFNKLMSAAGERDGKVNYKNLLDKIM